MTATKRTWGIIGILFIAALLIVPATQAESKTVNYKIICPVTRLEWIAVPDVEKHVLILYERRGVVIYENGEIAAYHTRGTSDLIKGQVRLRDTATFSIRTVQQRCLSILAL